MTKDEIIKMAKECELVAGNADHGIYLMALQRFAALVAAEVGIAQHRRGYESGLRDGAAAEREACAKVCAEVNQEYDGEEVSASWIAAAIRSRSSEHSEQGE